MHANRVSQLIPFVQVADVARSIAFYELVGFEVSDTYVHEGVLDFAALAGGDARTMLVRAAGLIDAPEQRVRFYLYADDLDALRVHLLSKEVSVGPIVDGSPGPRREMTVHDPDGYCLMIAEGYVE
ncbi:MAG: VOC family protein [Thermoleophilaceae bacterium]|nr:VOC family protein [Thermoleophilaceae bacterium]